LSIEAEKRQEIAQFNSRSKVKSNNDKISSKAGAVAARRKTPSRHQEEIKTPRQDKAETCFACLLGSCLLGWMARKLCLDWIGNSVQDSPKKHPKV